MHVGKRIRMRRALLNVSQEQLAERLGITFQQIQKYERGTNRVSASRLFDIGEALDVPVAYFYAEFYDPANKVYIKGLADNDQDPFLRDKGDKLLYNPETADLLKAYYSVRDESKRKELFKIFESMIKSVG
ncbi:MAG: helix-turn-helix transcriptional regulator [Proteobacteria bacterium]|nr:helix-turn-helix transcriptional regulator [Pseudomonadota bacterium]